jgi:hypothetical protein
MRRRENARFQQWLSAIIAVKIRNRLRRAIKDQSALKSKDTIALLGCSVSRFKKHIESQFKPGMSWANHGLVWHLDHIRPCCSFNLTEARHQKTCFNYKNVQPLFVAENLQKGGRYTSKRIGHQLS